MSSTELQTFQKESRVCRDRVGKLGTNKMVILVAEETTKIQNHVMDSLITCSTSRGRDSNRYSPGVPLGTEPKNNRNKTLFGYFHLLFLTLFGTFSLALVPRVALGLLP